MLSCLFNIAKSGIQTLRSERGHPEVEETVEEIVSEPVSELPPLPSVESSNTFSAEDLKRQMDTKPSVASPLTIPKTPVI